MVAWRYRRLWLCVTCASAGTAQLAHAERLPWQYTGDPPPTAPKETSTSRGEVLGALRAALPWELVLAVLDKTAFRSHAAVCVESGTSAIILGSQGQVCSLGPHGDVVLGVIFFDLGERAVTWSRGGVAVVWNASSCQALHSRHYDSAVTSARVFPGGDRAAACSEGGMCEVWSTRTGARLQQFVVQHATSLEVFWPGDRIVTWGSFADTTVWDMATGQPRCVLPSDGWDADLASVFAGGDRLVTSGPADSSIIWDARTCKELHKLVHDALDVVMDVAVLQSGAAVVTMGISGRAYIWSADSGLRLRTLVDNWPGASTRCATFPLDDRLVTFQFQAGCLVEPATGPTRTKP